MNRSAAVSRVCGAVMLAATLLAAWVAQGVLRSRNPAWVVEQFLAGAGRMRGAPALAAYVLVVLFPVLAGVAAWAIWSAARWTPGWHLGSVNGCLWAAALMYVQWTLPFVGEGLNAPGFPLAIRAASDARMADVMAIALGINLVTYGFVGACFSGTRRAGTVAASAAPRRLPFVAAQLGTLSATTAVAAVIMLWLVPPAVSHARGFAALFDALPTVDYRRAVTFPADDGTTLVMDVAVPTAASGRRPAVLCLHGGGWHGGTRYEYTPLAVELARRGYVAATLDYRLAAEHRFPAQIQDVFTAMRWLADERSGIAVDPHRIAVVGWSAGGHLACLAGATDAAVWNEHQTDAPAPAMPKPRAVVAWSALTDLTDDCWREYGNSARLLLGDRLEDDGDAYRRASPVHHLDGRDPPFLLLHGQADAVVPASQSESLAAACQAAGVPVSLHLVPGQGHRWVGRAAADAIDAVLAFLDRYLKHS